MYNNKAHIITQVNPKFIEIKLAPAALITEAEPLIPQVHGIIPF